MNLDSLYSELTLETKAKVVMIVLDGIGDIATREQKYLTPLEAAKTPNLDAIAKDSAQVGPNNKPQRLASRSARACAADCKCDPNTGLHRTTLKFADVGSQQFARPFSSNSFEGV